MSACPDELRSTAEDTEELDIENVAGIFFVLIGWTVLALLVCLLERVYKRRSMAAPMAPPSRPAVVSRAAPRMAGWQDPYEAARTQNRGKQGKLESKKSAFDEEMERTTKGAIPTSLYVVTGISLAMLAYTVAS